MQIQVQCPSCGAAFRARAELAGQSVQCPKCKTPFVVPAAPGQPAGPAAGMPASPNWYVTTSAGQQLGPMSQDELSAAVSQGMLDAGAMLLREDWQQWQPITAVFPQLAHQVPQQQMPQQAAYAPPNPFGGQFSAPGTAAAPRRRKGQGDTPGTVGLVLGIMSLVFGVGSCLFFPAALLGLVMGIGGYFAAARAHSNLETGGKVCSVIGMVLNGLFMLMLVFTLLSLNSRTGRGGGLESLLLMPTFCGIIVAKIWIIVIAFREEDTGWAIASIFILLVAVIYGFMNLHVTKAPMILLGACILLLLAMAMT